MEKIQLDLGANVTIAFYNERQKVYEAVMPYASIKDLDYLTFQLESFEGNASVNQKYLTTEVCKWYCDHLLWRVSDKKAAAEPKTPHPFVGLLAHFLSDIRFYDRLEIEEVKFKFLCKRGEAVNFQYGLHKDSWGGPSILGITRNLLKMNHLQELLQERDPNRFKDLEALSGIKWVDTIKAERFCECKDCYRWSKEDSYRVPEEIAGHVRHSLYHLGTDGMLPLEHRFTHEHKLRQTPLNFSYLLEETVEIKIPGGVYATSQDFYTLLYKSLENEKIQLKGRKGNKILYHPERPAYSGYRLEPNSMQKKQPDRRGIYSTHNFGEKHDCGDLSLRDYEDHLEVVINPLRRRQYDIKRIGEAEISILADNDGPILKRIISSYIEMHARSGRTYTRVLNFANNNKFIARYAWDNRREELVERFSLMRSFLKCNFDQLTKRVTGLINT